MSKYKRGHQQSVDKNELEIIKALEEYDLYIVRSMDDFLVYSSSFLRQIEVKTESPFNKNGTLKVGKIKDSQYKMLCYANDSYIILWTKEQALDYLVPDGYFGKEEPIFPEDFRLMHKEWLTTKELNRLRQLPWWNLS